MKEFITRTITAFFLILGAYLFIQFTPLWLFSSLLFVLLCFGAWELIKLAEPKIKSLLLIIANGFLISAYFTLPYLKGIYSGFDLSILLWSVIFIDCLYFLRCVKGKEELDAYIRDLGIYFLTAFYVFFPLFYLFKLKVKGPEYLYFLIAVVAVGDSAAYFIGKAVGKHKIYPVASPKKSLEGLVACIVFAGLTGPLAAYLFNLDFPLTSTITAGAAMGLLSQLADPVESLFKRSAGKKDSGSILPGHGGILDRVDSYVFCAPALFYITEFFWK